MIKPRLGRRGLVLILIGSLWLMTGWNVLMAHPPERELAPHEFAPVVWRAALWISCGVLAILLAVLPKLLRQEVSDRWGFFALILPPAQRCASWMASPALPLFGQPAPEVSFIATSVLVWGTITVLLLVIAGWKEPNPTIVVVGDPGEALRRFGDHA